MYTQEQSNDHDFITSDPDITTKDKTSDTDDPGLGKDPKDIEYWTTRLNNLSAEDWSDTMAYIPKHHWYAYDGNRYKYYRGEITSKEYYRILNNFEYWWLLELVYDHPGKIHNQTILNFMIAFFDKEKHYNIEFGVKGQGGFYDSFWARLFSDYLYLYIDHTQRETSGPGAIAIGKDDLASKMLSTGQYTMLAQAGWDMALSALSKYALFSLSSDSGVSSDDADYLMNQIREAGKFIEAGIVAQNAYRTKKSLEKEAAYNAAFTILSFVPYGMIFSAIGKYMKSQTVTSLTQKAFESREFTGFEWETAVTPQKFSKLRHTYTKYFEGAQKFGDDFMAGFKAIEEGAGKYGISPAKAIQTLLPIDLSKEVNKKILDIAGFEKEEKLNFEKHTGLFSQAFYNGDKGEINEIFKNMVDAKFQIPYECDEDGKLKDVVHILEKNMLKNNFVKAE